MNFSAFTEAMQSEVKGLLGQEIKVELHQVTKNNGITLEGLCIVQPGVRVIPTIYLEEFFCKYQEGVEIKELAREIIKVYERSRQNEDFSLDYFTDFSKIQHQVTLKLVNQKKNKGLLQDVPWIPYLDLAVVFVLNVQNPILGSGSILIRSEHLNVWNVTRELLYEYARENTLKLRPEKFLTMEEVIGDILLPGERPMMEELPMYVLSNEERTFGAVNILYDRVLYQVGLELKDNFYVLPSSIHEVILIPEKVLDRTDFLQEIVQEINETQVDPEEVLSDRIYYYDRDQHCLSIKCTKD